VTGHITGEARMRTGILIAFIIIIVAVASQALKKKKK